MVRVIICVQRPETLADRKVRQDATVVYQVMVGPLVNLRAKEVRRIFSQRTVTAPMARLHVALR